MKKIATISPMKRLQRIKRRTLDKFFKNPKVIASIKQGEEDIKAGRLYEIDPDTLEVKPYVQKTKRK